MIKKKTAKLTELKSVQIYEYAKKDLVEASDITGIKIKKIASDAISDYCKRIKKNTNS